MKINKSRYKPKYKHFLNLRESINGNPKLFKFKKRKWKNLIQRLTSFRRKRYTKKYFSHTGYQITRNAKSLKNGFRLGLATKKRLKFFYAKFSENQFKAKFKEASLDAKKTPGYGRKEDLLISRLESRLDSIFFRSYFLSSFRHIRQLISHGKVFVNGKKMVNYDYLVKPGDVITLDPKIHFLIKNHLLQLNTERLVPSYLQISYKTLSIVMVQKISIFDLCQLFPFWLNLKTIFHNYFY